MNALFAVTTCQVPMCVFAAVTVIFFPLFQGRQVFINVLLCRKVLCLAGHTTCMSDCCAASCFAASRCGAPSASLLAAKVALFSDQPCQYLKTCMQADAHTKDQLGDHHTANGIEVVTPPSAAAERKTLDSVSASSGSSENIEKPVV